MKKSDKFYVKKSGAKRFVANLRGIGEGQIGFATAEQAIAYYDQSMADHQNGEFVASSMNPRFDEVASAFLNTVRNRAATTDSLLAHHRRNISFLKKNVAGLSNRKMLDIDAGYIEEVIVPALFVQAHSTGRTRYDTVRQILKFAVKKRWLRSNPAREVDLPRNQSTAKVATQISKENIDAIIDAAAPEYRLQIKFAALTGLRAGEQVALRWDKVDLDERRLFVHWARKTGGVIGETKTGAGMRTVMLADELIAELREWQFRQPFAQRVKGLVFPSRTGNYADSNNWRNRGLIPACRAAGIKPIRWHDLRHYFASKICFSANFTDLEITQMMGHASIDLTRRVYAHWLADPDRDATIADQISAAFK